MGIVMLPLVFPGTPVQVAIDYLRARGCGGVVLSKPDGTCALLYAGDLLRARSKGITVVEQVTGARPVIVLDNQKGVQLQVDLVRPFRTQQSYEAMFSDRGVDYALVGESSDTVMLVTAHEFQEGALRSGGFECTGVAPGPTHYFPEPRVYIGDQCPQHPECSGPGGGVSTVRPI